MIFFINNYFSIYDLKKVFYIYMILIIKKFISIEYNDKINIEL